MSIRTIAVTMFITTAPGFAFAGTSTTATSSQWRDICGDGKSACTVTSEMAGQTTYKACAANRCYEVVCKADVGDGACTKAEIPGARPLPKTMQATIFGLL